MLQKFSLTFLLLLSGLCGISYEVLYGRVLGGILGDQFAVSAAVLVTFLLGIALGAKYAYRLWGKLWLIEAVIGLYGIGFAFAAKVIEVFLYDGLAFLPSLAGPIMLGTFLLIIPAFMIGCSVPLFAGYLSRVNAGPVFSGVYSVYNFGAALTALLIEFLLIRKFGISGTLVAFGLVNLAVAFVLFTLCRPVAVNPPARNNSPIQLPGRYIVSLILVSVASAIFQLFMVKISEMMFGPFRETFAMVLAIILFGIALGSYLVKRLDISYPRLLLGNVIGLLLFFVLYKYLLYFYADLYSKAAEHGHAIVILKAGVLFLLMGLPAITFGATIPALLNRQNEVSRESGNLLFISSLANVAGFLLMAFLLHKYLDYGVQLLVISGFVAAALIAYTWQPVFKIKSHLMPLGGVLVTLLSMGFQHWKWDENLLYLSYTSFRDLGRMKEDRKAFNFADKFKGNQDVFSITWSNGEPYFFINGYISIPMNNPSEKVVGAIGSMVSPKLDNALVLGLGSGATASTVGLLFNQTDVVEINPVVRENQYRMTRWNFDIEHNPKVNIIVDDAIHYARSSGKSYDMILNTVTSPLYFSSSKLYTLDFFDMIKKRLRPGGIYLTWMDSRVGTDGAEIILNTLKKRFRHCAIFFIKHSYFLLVASDNPVSLQHPDLVENSKELNESLFHKMIIPQDLAYNLLVKDVFAEGRTFTAPINTINVPALEFEMANLNKTEFEIFRKKLANSITLDAVSAFIEPAMKYDPVQNIAHVKMVMPESPMTSRFEQQGRIYINNYDERVDDAILQSNRHIAETVNDADAYHELGYQYRLRERYPEALIAFRKAGELDPKHINTQFNIALSLERTGQYSGALDGYMLAGQQNPKDPDVSYGMARIYDKLGEPEKALPYVDQSLKLRPLAEVYTLKAELLEKLGRKVDALATYRQLLEVAPDDKHAQKMLNKYLAKW